MRDPYEVLGVGRKADNAEIKKSFRKLAKKLHPDSNKGDPKAAARFTEINTAYEIIGDEEKRRAFDAGEIDAEGKPKGHSFDPRAGGFDPRQGNFRRGPDGETIFETFSHGPGGFQRGNTGGGFEDILSGIFGGAARGARGQRGGSGFGFEEFNEAQHKGADMALGLSVSLAEAVSGAKKRVVMPTGKEIEVTIPVGVVDGQQIRLRGQGFAGPGAPGDAIVTIHVTPHPDLKTDGANLRAEVNLPFEDAVLGGSIRVPTLDGAVDLKIPPWTEGGRTFRLKGKGIPQKNGSPGDLLVSVNITLPEAGRAEFEALAKKLRGG